MSTPARVTQQSSLPDIAQRRHLQPQGTLDWVGMSEIHQPIVVRDGNATYPVQAQVQLYVDLADPQAKGIHMSRLYLLLDEHSRTRPLSLAGIKLLLNAMTQSHLDISTRALVQFRFDYELRRQALLSDNAGWSSYPVTVTGTLIDGQIRVELGADVTYSSTCPCSAALARQLIQNAFADKFAQNDAIDFAEVREWLGSEEGIVATPHSQRSVAQIKTVLKNDLAHLPIRSLIDTLEDALGTPVQTAVKREDEQEFALRNGANLMFCEDAARKLKATLSADPRFDDFWLRVNHMESLHAHNAVSIVTKGMAGGYLPLP